MVNVFNTLLQLTDTFLIELHLKPVHFLFGFYRNNKTHQKLNTEAIMYIFAHHNNEDNCKKW